MSSHRLQKLVNVLKRTTTVSWKYEGHADELRLVQCYVDESSVHQLLHRAGINPNIHTEVVKQARRNGDATVGQAQQGVKVYIFLEGTDGVTSSMLKTMRRTLSPEFREVDSLNKWTVTCTQTQINHAARIVGLPASAIFNARQRAKEEIQKTMAGIERTLSYANRLPPIPGKPFIDDRMQARIDALRKAGCDIEVTVNDYGYKVMVFGERLGECMDDNYNVVMGILNGLQRGFTTAPLWTGAQQVLVPRATLNDLVDFVCAILHDGRFPPSTRMRSADAVLKRAKANPSELGSPQMGSTTNQRRLNVAMRAEVQWPKPVKATKRSKRSA